MDINTYIYIYPYYFCLTFFFFESRIASIPKMLESFVQGSPSGNFTFCGSAESPDFFRKPLVPWFLPCFFTMVFTMFHHGFYHGLYEFIWIYLIDFDTCCHVAMLPFPSPNGRGWPEVLHCSAEPRDRLPVPCRRQNGDGEVSHLYHRSVKSKWTNETNVKAV